MRTAKAYEVQILLRVRVLAADEDAATSAVSSEVVERLTPMLDELHAADPRFAGYCVRADELVEELE